MALLLSLSGCAGGGVRPVSWTGLTIVGEKMYAADIEQVRALNAADGETLWTFPEYPKESNLGVFYITPAVGEGRVIVASQITTGGFFSRRLNIVWALDAETGRELWRFEGASGQYIEGGALSDGIFVVGNGDGNIYALDAESGDLRWSFETGHHVWATPLIVADTVYIGSMDRHLYALSLADGQMRWDFPTEGAFASAPALRDDTLYIGAFDDTFYAIDARTGAERWRLEGEDWFWGSPAVYDEVVYATDVAGSVYALDAESGEQIWREILLDAQKQGVSVRAGPVLSEDGSRLFVGAQVGDQDGALYALDTADGFVLWSKPSDGRALSPPVVSESLVYEALLYGTHRIRALHMDNGREMWAYSGVEEQK
jgi:outer membrane protein assembly factor BamB